MKRKENKKWNITFEILFGSEKKFLEEEVEKWVITNAYWQLQIFEIYLEEKWIVKWNKKDKNLLLGFFLQAALY